MEYKLAILLNLILFLYGAVSMTAAYFTNNRKNSIIYFIAFYGVAILGFIMILIRNDQNNNVTLVLSNSLMLIAAIYLLVGISRFYNKLVQLRYIVIAMTIFFVSFIYFVYVMDDIIVRFFLYQIYAIVIFIMIFVRKRDVDKTKRIDIFDASIINMLVLLVVRLVVVILSDFSSIHENTDSFNVTLLGVSGIFIAQGIWYVINKSSLKDLYNTELVMTSAINSAEEMIILTVDNDYNYLYFNKYHYWIMKTFYGADIDKGVNLLDSISIEEDYKKAKLNYDRALLGESFIIVEKYGEGDVVGYFESRFFPITNDEDEVIGVSVYAMDITSRKKQENQIVFLSNHDSLTGLYNRRYFESYVKDLSDEHLPMGMIAGDLNGLKLVNDSFGHASGDELLVKISEAINAEVRSQDVVVRFGGDEFVILLPKTEKKDIVTLIDRLNTRISSIEVKSVIPSVSFGFTVIRNLNIHIDQHYKECEDMLYKNKLTESRSMHNNVIDIIKSTIFEKNEREALHSDRVAKFTRQLAVAAGYNENYASHLELAATMHDIGKIGIPEYILNKEGKLTEEEFDEIRKHTEIGYRILSSHSDFSGVADDVLQHHERIDGKGYPQGLKGDEIRVGAKIICIADAFDAMTSVRTYKEPLTIDEAVQELRDNAGTQFDEKFVELFINEVLRK